MRFSHCSLLVRRSHVAAVGASLLCWPADRRKTPLGSPLACPIEPTAHRSRSIMSALKRAPRRLIRDCGRMKRGTQSDQKQERPRDYSSDLKTQLIARHLKQNAAPLLGVPDGCSDPR